MQLLHFGTALTEMQGRLLRKYSEKVIISYDSDGAGQAATLRGLDILTNMGCDVRILQMEGAKDPDEYVIKYGNGRFKLLINDAISLVQFKTKVLKKDLDLKNTNDRIRFLKEIAKLLTSVNSKIEQEIYLTDISKEYGISKEAIYAEINKITGKTAPWPGVRSRDYSQTYPPAVFNNVICVKVDQKQIKKYWKNCMKNLKKAIVIMLVIH